MNIEEFLSEVIGKRMTRYFTFFIIGLLLFFFVKGSIEYASIGILVSIVCFFFILYELKVIYYLKFKKGADKLNAKGFKGEKFIADYFDRKKIKWIYEKPIKIGGITLHPDFYLPGFDVYVEYYGGFKDKQYYERDYKQKHILYQKYKEDLDVIELFPDNLSSMHQLDFKFTQRLNNILKNR